MTTNPNPDPAPQLKPHRFTSEKARQAGLKSAEARRARKALQAKTATELATQLHTVRTTFEGLPLVETITATLGLLLARLAAGEIPVRHAGDLADVVRALHEVARLEAGQPTSIAASVSVDASDALERLRELQQQARAALAELPASAAVPTADDDPARDTPADTTAPVPHPPAADQPSQPQTP